MKLIKEARKACKIKQFHLAKIMSIDQSNYSNIENGILVLRSIESVKKKAASILLPKLSDVISDKQKELERLNELSDYLNKLINP